MDDLPSYGGRCDQRCCESYPGVRRPCVTPSLRVHGHCTTGNGSHLDVYGSDATRILQLISDNPHLSQQIHPSYPFTLAEIHWAVREEMALTVEDVLTRRIHLLFTDARAAIEAAPAVAREIVLITGRGEEWVSEQVSGYCPSWHFYNNATPCGGYCFVVAGEAPTMVILNETLRD